MKWAAGKVVLIAGGAGGIGTSAARRFHEAGAVVWILDRNEEALQTASGDLKVDGTCARTICCDVTKADACRAAVEHVMGEAGRLDCLVYSVGLTQISRCAETEESVYRRVMDANFFGAVGLTQAALPALQRARGQVIVLSSIAGFAPLWGRTGYCASKYALHGFFDTLRCELRDDDVAVTLVCPSFVDTEFARRGLRGDGTVRASGRTTRGRLLTADDVAGALLEAMRKRRRFVVIPMAGKIAFLLSRIAPRIYERIMLRQYAEQRATDATGEMR